MSNIYPLVAYYRELLC